MDTARTYGLTEIITEYTPRITTAFNLDPEYYEATPDNFERLIEDAAEAAAEDVDVDDLLSASGYLDNASQPDATGERFRGYLTGALDAVLSRQQLTTSL